MNTSANASSYDYWWFGVVSEQDNTALNVVFFNAGDIGNPQPIAVEISGVFSIGTKFLSQALSPSGATVSNGPEGVCGYHDKNWGDKTVLESPKFWDCGHTRLGPYSLVWYDPLDYDDKEYHHSYIAKNNEILKVSCDQGSVVTRPWGRNATWAPVLGLNAVNGVASKFNLGNGETFVINVAKEAITYDQLVYTRAVGVARGGIDGSGEIYEGKSFFDEFTYGLVF